MLRVLVSDPVHQDGVKFLEKEPDLKVDVRLRLPKEELLQIIGDYDALVVRSETKVTADVLERAKKLQVVARAGVGVDNIDLEAATRLGVAVVNAPTGNIMAAAEHTVALLFALARHIPQADASMRRGEWRRSDFMGVEVRGKTLGILGLGRVGSEVAQRLQGFHMRFLAFDPFVSQEYASRLNVELVELDRLLRESDFITIHTPLTSTTRGLVSGQEIAKMKPGVRIINVARGGLIDEAALLEALNSGHVAGAAVDVFSQEPPKDNALVAHAKVIVTPHLGASTFEAQRDVAVEAAEQVLAVLRGKAARYTVNAPSVVPETEGVVAPYVQVANTVGRLASQLADGPINSVTLTYEGDISRYNVTILKAAAVMGLLQPVTAERVNLVNALFVAQERGLKILEQKGPAPEQYSSLLTIEIDAKGGVARLSATHMRGETHVVRVGEHWLDLVPSTPYMLFIDHRDRPGLIGAVGTLTGQHDINISFMEVGRLEPRGRATMILGLDDPMPEEVQNKIRAIPHIYGARLVHI